MNGRSILTARALATTLLAVTLSGAAVSAQPKMGGAPEPVVLDLAVGGYSGGWPVDHFKSKVAELSEGQLDIRETYSSSPYEATVAEEVRSGDADLGLVFARSLDGIGAKGFQALLAPFVANDAVLQRAIAAGPIGADVLAELRDHGLEGLAIVPGDRRFVVGMGRPFDSLDDFAGATINVPETAATFAFIRALGAEPSGEGWDDRDDLEAAGIDGVITSVASVADPRMVLTSNLAVQAVPNVWFANAGVMAELSQEHQEILRAAAISARDAVLEGFTATESTAMPCAAGARIVAASDDDLSAIIEAAKPVVDALASDPVTATFLDRIAALKAETAPAPFPASCDGTPPAVVSSRIPDGTYRATVTNEDALRTGHPDHCVSPTRTLVETLVIENDGRNATELQTCGDGPTEVASRVVFEYEGDTLLAREPGFPGSTRWAWSADDSSFTLTLLEAPDADQGVLRFLFEHEFTRVSPPVVLSSIPDGTYKATITHEHALKEGLVNDCTTPDRSAVVTLVVEGSDFTELQQCGDEAPVVGSEGTFQYAGDTVAMRSPGIPGEAVFSWTADESGFTLTYLRSVDETGWPPAMMRFMFEHEFARVSR